MLTPALVEFLGTGLIVGTAAFAGSPLMIVAALCIAITLGGKISGGYFNPAVTLYHLVSGHISRTKAMYYIVAQLAAGLGIGLVSGML